MKKYIFVKMLHLHALRFFSRSIVFSSLLGNEVLEAF